MIPVVQSSQWRNGFCPCFSLHKLQQRIVATERCCTLQCRQASHLRQNFFPWFMIDRKSLHFIEFYFLKPFVSVNGVNKTWHIWTLDWWHAEIRVKHVSTHLSFPLKCCFLISRQNGLSSTHPLPLVGETPSGVVGDAPFDHETRLEVKHDICWRSFTCTQISWVKQLQLQIHILKTHKTWRINISVTWPWHRGVLEFSPETSVQQRSRSPPEHGDSWFEQWFLNSSSQLAFSLGIFLVQRPYLASRGLSC